MYVCVCTEFCGVLAGKSSLILTLMRVMEKDSGFVEIDGVDVHQLDLHVLRSRIALIPQVHICAVLCTLLNPCSLHVYVCVCVCHNSFRIQ